MAIDSQPAASAQTPPSPRPHGASSFARMRTWIIGLLGVGMVTALAWGISRAPRSEARRTLAPKVTHTITRGELLVTVTEKGKVESSNNTEIKCRVRGNNTVIWVVESGTHVKAGDKLVRLDTLLIEEQISERTKFAHMARSASERSKADMIASELAISEYLKGRFPAELMSLEKDLAIAESNLRTQQNMLGHAKRMADSGYVSELEVEEKAFAVKRAELNVTGMKTQIDVLKQFTKEEELATLRGNLAANKAKHAADAERAFADEHRRQRALSELRQCVIRAERGGMVIHPRAAAWKEAPDIEAGATVHQNQILLLMPDLTKMQVKIGVHESLVDRIQAGLRAKVVMTEKSFDARVTSVASVARPAGWWTGNVVKYDTIIQLPSTPGLKPGMSADVEITLARYENVLTIPVAAVLETETGSVCWVETPAGTERRDLRLGDGSKTSLIVESGLQEGDAVVLNPLECIEDAQDMAAMTIDETRESAQSNSPNPASNDGEGDDVD